MKGRVSTNRRIWSSHLRFKKCYAKTAKKLHFVWKEILSYTGKREVQYISRNQIAAAKFYGDNPIQVLYKL